ncbi:MAG TPA: hypothetical protein VH700_00835 [Gemmatimonadales bacterium]
MGLSAQVQEIRWDELQRQGSLTAGTVLPATAEAPFSSLKIEGGPGGPVTIAIIERPAVKGPRYAVTGQVRYEGVEATGYLEMWNHFPNGGQYFSRTLADAGPMRKLQGSSGWRRFTLPFDATGAPPPTRLVINVVLPGRGSVYFGPLQLVEGVPGADGAGLSLDRRAGLIGGIAGGLLGCVGALIGVLASRGRGKRFVTIALMCLALGGIVAFAAGVVALSRSMPYAVYYPLLLIGFLATVVPLGLRPSIRRRYEEIELRRMRAHDLG